MEEKENIQRENLRGNIMKNIIFRIDYQGMIDSKDFVKIFTQTFPNKFNSYTINTQNSLDLQLNNIDDLSNTLSIPVTEIKKQDIHRFKENTFGKDKLTLDISIFSTILNIECLEYENIDIYIEFMKRYLEILLGSNEYIALKRFGLRKIGSNIYFELAELYSDFEKRYFMYDYEIEDYYSLKYRCEEVLYNDKHKLNINFIRIIDTGLYFDEEKKENIKAIQATLDLDAYMNEESLIFNEYKSNLKDLMAVINNHYLFDIFKKSVTSKFLNKNLNGKN
jgi:uncharacterized protein (TIGR04255 family)